MQVTSLPCGYSGDTEILTRHGWMRFGELTYMSEVATRSLDGRFEWQYPERITCHPYEGEMVAFSNKSMDLLVAQGTPVMIRRPVAYLRKHPNAEGKRWHYRPAAYFAANPAAQWEVPATSSWHASEWPGEFLIPGWKASRPHPAWDQATEWLVARLANEWTHSGELQEARKAAGISPDAYSAARRNLGVMSRRVGGWGWGPTYWETSRPTRMHVPAIGPYTPQREFRAPMDAFCAFLGIYVAEGWVAAVNQNIIVSQFETSRHLPEIRDILDATGLHWTYQARHGKFVTSHKALAAWLTANAGHRARNKRIPPGFKDLPVGLLKVMLRGGMIGDGHWEVGVRRYTTSSWQLADDVQEIFQKTGADAWIRVTEPEEMAKYDQGGILTRHRLYVVRERLQENHWLAPARSRDYSGHIVSAAVPNCMIYVRRGGRSIWCGAPRPT